MKKTILLLMVLFAIFAKNANAQLGIMPVHTDSAKYSPDQIHVWAHIKISPLGTLSYLGYATQDSAHKKLTNLWVASQLKMNVINVGPAGLDSFVADVYIPITKTGDWWCWIGGWDSQKDNLDSSNMVKIHVDTIVGKYTSVTNVALEEKTNFEFSPNPAKDFIEITNNDFLGSIIKIYDSQGKLLKTEIILNKSTKVDVSDLPNGFYFINLKNCYKKLLIKR